MLCSPFELADEDLERVLKPKVAGAWNLHRAFADRGLERLRASSSVRPVLESPCCAYAAANAFLDGLAWHRRSKGLSATSINWGPWAEVGMAAQSQAAGWGAATLRGMSTVPLAAGFELMERLIESGVPQTAVLPIDWKLWLEFHPTFATRPFFEDARWRGAYRARLTGSAAAAWSCYAATARRRPEDPLPGQQIARHVACPPTPPTS